MSKHYMYNCLLKNDINLVWLAVLFSLFHCLYFYDKSGIFAIIIVLFSALISTIALAISIRFKAVINVRQNMSLLMLGAFTLTVINSLQYQTNDISNIFITFLSIFSIILSGFNIKDLMYITKIDDLPSNKIKINDYSVSDMVSLYKFKIHEVIRYNDEGHFERRSSLFFDYQLNMAVDRYEMTSFDDGKVYKLHDFINHCKENNISISKRTKEDFEVFKMMII